MPDRCVVQELYRTVVLLGGPFDLLGLIGSWGEGLPAEDVLAGLKAWNAGTVTDLKERISHYETSAPRSDCTPGAAP